MILSKAWDVIGTFGVMITDVVNSNDFREPFFIGLLAAIIPVLGYLCDVRDPDIVALCLVPTILIIFGWVIWKVFGKPLRNWYYGAQKRMYKQRDKRRWRRSD